MEDNLGDTKGLRVRLIKAGRVAVEQLIKVAEEEIISDIDSLLAAIEEEADVGKKGLAIKAELAADKLKNAAAAKKLAIFDAFEILDRIEEEDRVLNPSQEKRDYGDNGWAETRAS